MYKVWVAYLLWLVSVFGILGFHRFYLMKIPTGVIWFMTGGLFFMGAIYDFFTLARQVSDANLRDGYLRVSLKDFEMAPPLATKDSLEKSILKAAQKHSGRITPSQVVLEGDWTIEQVQTELDKMAKRGVCELRVLKTGTMVYTFIEFDPQGSKEFEV